MYDDILVPTDGGERMDDVVEQALKVADDRRTTIHALSVIDEGTFLTLDDDLKAAVEEDLARKAERAVGDVADVAADGGVDVETAVRRGQPGEEITAYAEATGADLIVIGSRGSETYEKRMLGSVSKEVVSDAACPVLTVPLDS